MLFYFNVSILYIKFFYIFEFVFSKMNTYPISHWLFWASKTWGLFGLPFLTFVLEQQWCLNVVSSFTSCISVQTNIQVY